MVDCVLTPSNHPGGPAGEPLWVNLKRTLTGHNRSAAETAEGK